MRLLPSIILLAALFTATTCLNAQTETNNIGDLQFTKLGNGLNSTAMSIPGASATEITLYVKTGSIYESDSVSGIANIIQNILADKVVAGMRSGKSTVTFQNSTFSAYSTTEHAVFKISTQPANISGCLILLRDSLFNSKIRPEELLAAKTAELKEIEEKKFNKKKLLEDRIIRNMYRQDQDKVNVQGNPKKFGNITTAIANIFFKKYYVPNNTLVAASGNLNGAAFQSSVETTLNPLFKSEFNPEAVTKIVDLRPMAYSSQFIVEDTVNTPEFEICWQFPGTATNQRASYCAYLVNAMLNDKNNYIQAKAAKMGCKKFTVQYEANNFSGVLRITLQPSKQNLAATCQFVIKEIEKFDKTLINEVMINAGKIQFKREYDGLKKTNEYPNWVMKFRTYDDETYFTSLSDSVKQVTASALKNFCTDYLSLNPHIAGLLISKTDRDALKVDSLFTDLDDGVGKYVFRYKLNITDLEGQDNAIMQRNLLQWLLINTEVHVQVNGFSDQREYGRAYDDSVMQFIDSLPTFQKSKEDIIKKGYLRPEMMRALKIIKYFYDHGISADRLSGTSMVYTSSNKKEEAENMKCTLSLSKIHKTPSLYEYHYGKKKE